MTPISGDWGCPQIPRPPPMERGGKVVAQPSPKVDQDALTTFLTANVDTDALLMTDEYAGYNRMGQIMRHSVIKHAAQYVDGLIHTNTVEGFWSLLKRAWYGTHHHYSDDYALAYAVEFGIELLPS